jgi:fumarate hydratase class II
LAQKIISSLEEIARLTKASAEPSKVEDAVKLARAAVQDAKGPQELDKELSIWRSKLSVILNEPAGRQGMVKHVHYWVERLKKLEVGSSKLEG